MQNFVPSLRRGGGGGDQAWRVQVASRPDLAVTRGAARTTKEARGLMRLGQIRRWGCAPARHRDEPEKAKSALSAHILVTWLLRFGATQPHTSSTQCHRTESCSEQWPPQNDPSFSVVACRRFLFFYRSVALSPLLSMPPARGRPDSSHGKGFDCRSESGYNRLQASSLSEPNVQHESLWTGAAHRAF